MIAKICGIKDEAVRSPLAAEMGEAGTAHALIMLAHALEEAKAGEKILVLQFGSGWQRAGIRSDWPKADASSFRREGSFSARTRRGQFT